ncbi:NEDD4-binding protein 2-like 2 isoform X2 [Carettochelys insculpta]|uniref:NEDD4-binding protein 2-like 2 isoform X2 n=1 Tax=Carettochelys insculpta TaxID=44489 RepID=UPI003EB996AF
MLHAEYKVRPLEWQDEMTIEPCSKKMKSTDDAHDEFWDNACQGAHVITHTERTNNEWIPSCISDEQGKQELEQKENENKDILKTSSEEVPGNSPEIESSHSKIMQSISLPRKDSEIMDNKCPFISEEVNEVNIKETSNYSCTVNGGEVEIEEYSTSKAFIGPLYRPMEENKQSETMNFTKFSTVGEKQNTVVDHKFDKEEAKQTLSCGTSEIDEELCQFYKEIQQLESDKDELEDNLQQTKTGFSQERPISCNKYSQTSHEDEQDVWYSRKQSYDSEQCFYNEPSGQKTDSEPKCFDNETNGCGTENHFNWQADSKFWNHSVPQFRPGLQPTQSFIIPQGPPPPMFQHHVEIKTLNSPPHQSNILHLQNDGSHHKNYVGYGGNSGDTNRICPLFDQTNSYAGRTGIHSTHISKNGSSNQNGCINSGFCETRKECWKDPRTYQTEEVHNFQQFSEENLCRSQKLLLILRGLPGSGKTTLSRILHGQNPDGVVFSTDDYFRQQDGYTYNVAQLGDAHNWNQKRAKQAMDQGRSPVIIDNTNTQAWEMKPYVETALGKGYRVEFHEPDTWWKFDPEELEKRNKHGVSREKIAQMLERYEYQMSISLVMNSVEPPHKNTQRPPPHRRQREPDIKKKPGHRLSKMKQKKKRKRNRSMKHNHGKITPKKSDIPNDQETSESEEDDSEEESRKSVFTFSEDPGAPVESCDAHSNGDNTESLRATEHRSESSPIAVSKTTATSGSPMKSDLLEEDGGPFLINLASASNKKLIEFTLDDQTVDLNQTKTHMENESNYLNISVQGSFLETDFDSIENSGAMFNNQDELKSDQTACEDDLESKLFNVSNRKKETLSPQRDLRTSEICVVLPDKTIKERQISKRNEKNHWAFFSVDLTDTQLQLGFDKPDFCSWPESAHKFICEQRPKRVRRPKQTYPDSTVEQTHESNEEIEKEAILQILNEESGSVTVSQQCLQSLLIGKGHISFNEMEVTLTKSLTEVNVARNVDTPVPSKKKRRCKRIFNLAPNFHIPRHIAVSIEEGKKGVLLMDDHILENISEAEEEKISSKGYGKNEQNLEFQEHLASSDNDVTDSSLCFPKKAVSSPAQKFPSSFCIASSTKEQIITSKEEKIFDNKEGDGEQLSSELTNSQPDILCTVKVTSECPTDANVFESCGEPMHKADDSEPSQLLQIEDDQDPLNTKSHFLGLPLSLGFAFQLVELFGSPGFPLETLLPDDYIVPLDWKTSKKIHLLWKMSVERKQKKNGLQNGNSLAVGVKTAEDTNKDCQESEKSSETHLETHLYQDVVEEKTMTYPDKKHLYNISTNIEDHYKQKKTT